MIRFLYRSLVSAFCVHDWHTWTPIRFWTLDGVEVIPPPTFRTCRKCGKHYGENKWDD